jgi:hypothetical protein
MGTYGDPDIEAEVADAVDMAFGLERDLGSLAAALRIPAFLEHSPLSLL